MWWRQRHVQETWDNLSIDIVICGCFCLATWLPWYVRVRNTMTWCRWIAQLSVCPRDIVVRRPFQDNASMVLRRRRRPSALNLGRCVRASRKTKSKKELRRRKATEEMFYPVQVLAAKRARNNFTALLFWDGYAEEESTWQPVLKRPCIIRTLYFEYEWRLAKLTAITRTGHYIFQLPGPSIAWMRDESRYWRDLSYNFVKTPRLM